MVGRKKEMQELNDLYNSNRAEFVAVYGRRRVGKTYLIDETFQDRITFRHTGLSPAEHERKGFLKKQLDAFYYSLIKSGMSVEKKPKSWMEAFFMLETFLNDIDNGERQLVFIDELPWMDTPRSGFMTALECFWNGWACHHSNRMVIVCGSTNSWILDNLINNHGGLYNRVTYQIELFPFDLKECEQFFQDRAVAFSRYDIVQSYMAVGGIPYYLGYFRRDFSLAQNLDYLFFSKKAKLRDEFNRLFDSIFDKPEFMKKIVRTLYSRNTGFTRGDLIKTTGATEGETMSKCLNALVASEFVAKYIPFGRKESEPYYKLIDPFCLFYLHFVDSQKETNEQFWEQNVTSQPVVTWRGFAFENVCFNHIDEIKRALGISGVASTYSAWTKKSNDEPGTQVDLLISRNDNVINMCEMKYYGSDFMVNKDYFKVLLHRQDLLAQEVSRKVSVRNTLITTYGLRRNEYSSVFTNVITMDDLFN